MASASSDAAVSAGMVLPDWAFTWLLNARRFAHAPASSPVALAIWAALTLSSRAAPGPKPETAWRKSASCSAAPFTCTLKLACDSLPDESVAVQFTVVVLIGKMLPDGGSHATSGLGSVSSVAVTPYGTVAPAGLVAFTSMLPGVVRTGGVVSSATRPKMRTAAGNPGGAWQGVPLQSAPSVGEPARYSKGLNAQHSKKWSARLPSGSAKSAK